MMPVISARCFRIGSLCVALSSPFAAGCASPISPGESLAVTTVAEAADSESAVATESTFVIRDADTLRRIWAQVFGNRTTRAMPAIDFDEQMVVIASMGAQPSTGYGIKIAGASRGTAAKRRGREIVVSVTTTTPGPTCAVAPTITYPVAVSRLRKTDANVRFEFTRTTRDCAGR